MTKQTQTKNRKESIMKLYVIGFQDEYRHRQNSGSSFVLHGVFDNKKQADEAYEKVKTYYERASILFDPDEEYDDEYNENPVEMDMIYDVVELNDMSHCNALIKIVKKWDEEDNLKNKLI